MKLAREAKAEAEAEALKKRIEQARIDKAKRLAEIKAYNEFDWDIRQRISEAPMIKARLEAEKKEREEKERKHRERYEDQLAFNRALVDRMYAPLEPSEFEKLREDELNYRDKNYKGYIMDLYDGKVFTFEPTPDDLKAVEKHREKFVRRSEEPKAITTPLERERIRDRERATIEAEQAVASHDETVLDEFLKLYFPAESRTYSLKPGSKM